MALSENKYILIRFWGIDNGELPNDENTKYISIETDMAQSVVYCMSKANEAVGDDPRLFVNAPKRMEIQPGADQEIKYFIFYSLSTNDFYTAFNEIENIPKFSGWVREEAQLVNHDNRKSCAELVWYLFEQAGIEDLSTRGLISSCSSSVDTFTELFHELFEAKNVELKKHEETRAFMGTEGQTVPKSCAIL